MKNCPRCGQHKTDTDFYVDRRWNNRQSWCKTCLQLCNKEILARNKRLVYDHYGNECVWCGEDFAPCLTIDHVNNDGAAHRREIGPTNQMHRFIIKNGFPDSFQILCQNCNVAKHLNGGFLPIQLKNKRREK